MNYLEWIGYILGHNMELNKTRILHLTNVMDIGGVQKIIYEICAGTQQAFDRIVVASSGGEYADKVEKIGVIMWNKIILLIM